MKWEKQLYDDDQTATADEWQTFKWAMGQVIGFLIVAGLIDRLTGITFDQLLAVYMLFVTTWIFYRVGRDE